MTKMREDIIRINYIDKKFEHRFLSKAVRYELTNKIENPIKILGMGCTISYLNDLYVKKYPLLVMEKPIKSEIIHIEDLRIIPAQLIKNLETL